jgi:hypothetical protein
MGFHYCIAFAKKASWIGRLALALHPEREARRRSGFEQRRRGGRQQQRTVSPAHPPRMQHPPPPRARKTGPRARDTGPRWHGAGCNITCASVIIVSRTNRGPDGGFIPAETLVLVQDGTGGGTLPASTTASGRMKSPLGDSSVSTLQCGGVRSSQRAVETASGRRTRHPMCVRLFWRARPHARTHARTPAVAAAHRGRQVQAAGLPRYCPPAQRTY